jgi:N-methylhydantoinase A
VLHDYIRSELKPLDQVERAHAEAIFSGLAERAAAELAAEGLSAKAARHERALDMRYTGQGYELTVPMAGSLTATRARFDAMHAAIHGHAARERPVEIVSYRLRVRVPAAKYRPVPAKAARQKPAPLKAMKGLRAVRFVSTAETKAVLYERDRLPPGARIKGPAVVEQFDATTVVPPGWAAQVDRLGNLVVNHDKS